MSRIWMSGLEPNSVDVFGPITGALTTSAVDPRSGTYCLLTPGGNTNYARIILTPLRAEVFIRIYAKTVTNTPGAFPWLYIFDGGSVLLFEILEKLGWSAPCKRYAHIQ